MFQQTILRKPGVLKEPAIFVSGHFHDQVKEKDKIKIKKVVPKQLFVETGYTNHLMGSFDLNNQALDLMTPPYTANRDGVPFPELLHVKYFEPNKTTS